MHNVSGRELMKASGLATAIPGLHVAIIMDGNGRWASRRGQPRLAGHRAGAKAVRRTVEAAAEMGIGVLTLYAFSADNWSRPAREVSGLMRLFRAYLAAETARCVQNGVQLRVIGRRDRLSPVLLDAIEASERATRYGRRLLLRVAVDYSSRDTIIEASRRIDFGAEVERGVDRDCFGDLLCEAMHSPPVPPVDLLIRSGGEQRLSDFLLWECAYAELVFDDCLWPDFTPARLETALQQFERRERRFGALPRAAAG
jgi:undecaprenyl diphosphate synthase